ncbi:MAG: NPCBM/NEW2 domain-containing protein [Pirellulales bacterium]|nr:NPCBM/NEW2 domain-containing protein [Pirellulales bacterium]
MSRALGTFAVVLAGLASGACAWASEPREAIPVEGAPFSAVPVEITAPGEVRWSPDQPRSTAPGELLEWGAPADPRAEPLVVFTGGGVLPANVKVIEGEVLRVDAFGFGPLPIRLATVAGLIFVVGADRVATDRLIDRLTAGTATSDVVILDNGDELTGTLSKIERTKVELVAELGPITIDRDKVAAVALAAAAWERPADDARRWWFGTADGARLQARSLKLEGGALTAELASGLEVTAPADSLVWLHAIRHRGVWLTDLQPAGYRHVPYLDVAWEPAIDRGVSGGLLRVRDRIYLRGVGLHSAARITFPLDGQYRRFACQAAIDDSAQGRGSVVFRVYVDEQERFRSPLVTGSQAPLPIEIDVAGGKLLSLIVDYGQQADELDHAAWLNPRLVK